MSDEEHSTEPAPPKDGSVVIKRVIERKKREIKKLESKKDHSKDTDLINFLKHDVVSYNTILADITETDVDPAIFEEDADLVDDYTETEWYKKYMDGLSQTALKDENTADQIRFDRLDEIMDELSYEIGYEALSNKKVIKAFLKDEVALILFGEIILQDDVLYQTFEDTVAKTREKKEKKKKSKRGE
jgi:hypothetical protein